MQILSYQKKKPTFKNYRTIFHPQRKHKW